MLLESHHMLHAKSDLLVSRSSERQECAQPQAISQVSDEQLGFFHGTMQALSDPNRDISSNETDGDAEPVSDRGYVLNVTGASIAESWASASSFYESPANL